MCMCVCVSMCVSVCVCVCECMCKCVCSLAFMHSHYFLVTCVGRSLVRTFSCHGVFFICVE